MREISKRVKERYEKLIEAGFKAVDELEKVAAAKIPVSKKDDDKVSAEKMKLAASAKKMAILDSMEILVSIQDMEKRLMSPEEIDEREKSKPVKKDIEIGSPESRASK